MTFNEGLGTLLVLIIPALWVLHAQGIAPLPGEVMGALIATWTLVIQFFFRKAKNNGQTK